MKGANCSLPVADRAGNWIAGGEKLQALLRTCCLHFTPFNPYPLTNAREATMGSKYCLQGQGSPPLRQWAVDHFLNCREVHA